MAVRLVNGTVLKSPLRAVFCRESVHPGHVNYFAYSTICQLLQRNCLEPVAIGFFYYPTISRVTSLVVRRLGVLAPATADGIIVMARSTG